MHWSWTKIVLWCDEVPALYDKRFGLRTVQINPEPHGTLFLKRNATSRKLSFFWRRVHTSESASWLHFKKQISHDLGSHDPGPREKSMKKSCVSFDTECSWRVGSWRSLARGTTHYFQYAWIYQYVTSEWRNPLKSHPTPARSFERETHICRACNGIWSMTSWSVNKLYWKDLCIVGENCRYVHQWKMKQNKFLH